MDFFIDHVVDFLIGLAVGLLFMLFRDLVHSTRFQILRVKYAWLKADWQELWHVADTLCTARLSGAQLEFMEAFTRAHNVVRSQEERHEAVRDTI